MAHITIMSGSASMANKHLRPDIYGKRDSNTASCQNIDRMGVEGQNPNGDGENGDRQKTCIQKYKTWAYFGCIGVVIVLTVILVILAATGVFDTTGS